MTPAKITFTLIVLCAASAQAIAANRERDSITFSERSPHSAPDEVLARMEIDFFDAISVKTLRREALDEMYNRQKVYWDYNLDDEPFEVTVPTGYRPDVPHGLLIWMGLGDVPEGWREEIAKHKLILVVARNVSERSSVVRASLALDAVHNLKKRYNVDESRVYLAGFGSGAQIAAWVLRGWPEVFSGGCFLMGGWFYSMQLGYTDWYFTRSERDGKWYADSETMAPAWKSSTDWPMDRIQKEKKIVLMRGGRNASFNGPNTPPDDRLQYEGLVLDGFARASYIEIPEIGHEMPGPQWFEKGLAALEAEPKPTPTTAPTHEGAVLAQSQVDQARRLLVSAMHGGTDESIRRKLERIIADYPTTPSAPLARKGLDYLKRHPSR